MTKRIDLSPIGNELDRVGLARLEDQYPALVTAIERAISEGATPEQIRRYALSLGIPRSVVAWLEQAARALETNGIEDV